MAEKKKLKTVAEIADGLVIALNETEDVLNTFRNIGKYKFREKIHMSDVELNETLNKDTESFIRTRSEYEIMYHFLEKKGLMEKYIAFRAEVHTEIQERIKPEVEDEQKA